jgi:protein SCO1/2
VFRFYEDLLKGKIVLVNFFYTACGEICPLATQNLTYVQELLGPRVGKDIFMYSISLLPEHDPPEQFTAYAEIR